MAQDDPIRLHLEEVSMRADPENPAGEGIDRSVLLAFYDAGKDLAVEVRADVIQIRDIVADAYKAGLLDDDTEPLPDVRRKIENLPPGDPGTRPGW